MSAFPNFISANFFRSLPLEEAVHVAALMIVQHLAACKLTHHCLGTHESGKSPLSNFILSLGGTAVQLRLKTVQPAIMNVFFSALFFSFPLEFFHAAVTT